MYRTCVIGCGRMGRLHGERLQNDPRCELVAFYDQQPALAATLRRELAPTAQVLEAWDDVLRLNLDVAVICTPTTAHYQQVREGLERGWHLLCEKPLAESAERIDELIGLADTVKSCTMLAYQRRGWATFRTMRREVLSGHWGALRAVTFQSWERWEQTIAGTWRDDPEINIGGFVGDAGSHKIDLLHFVTGLGVEELVARSSCSRSRVEVVTLLIGALTGGVPLSMTFVGNAQHQGEDLHLHFEQADLMLRSGQLWIAQGNDVRPFPVEELEPAKTPTEAFLDLVSGAGPNIAPFACARPVWDVTWAILAGGGKVR
ncbi:MAG: Gfo/Idh/MocA family oxidoreductase [Planctomycetaceae bacterium]|nr:Gfo/Idh/MocA family oxidoreductase [Planctomycetaceae bacterium]